jgi:predicted DNA-binding protein
MPTAKKRINITVDDELFKSLDRLSKKEDRSISNVSLTLIEKALELQEDLYFSRVADERLKRNEKKVPHSKAWND